MTHDPTENIRRVEQAELNAAQAEREALEAKYGQVWSTEQVREDFEVIGFMAPYIGVQRKSDRKKGSLQFQHHPRYYFNWSEDSK
jgi:hypothetical protein